MASPLPQVLGEPFVAEFMERSFLADFVFRNPHITRGALPKEVADTLVWFDESLIVVQVKSFDPLARQSVDLDRRISQFNKQREGVYRQLKGAFRILSGGLVKQLDNRRRGPIAFDFRQVKEVFGLAILDDVPAALPAIVETMRSGNCRMSVLTLATSDFGHLCSDLSTAPDLLDYLRDRVAFARNIIPGAHSELDVLSFYLDAPDDFRTLGKQNALMRIPVGGWVRHFGSTRRLYRDHINEDSYVIDTIIDLLHTSIEHESDKPMDFSRIESSESPRTPKYLVPAMELARISRMQRRRLASILIEKSKLINADSPSRHYVIKCDRCIPMAFVVSSLPRDQRMDVLASVSMAAKIILKTKRLLGVGLPSLVEPGRSVDCAYHESNPEDDLAQVNPEFLQWAGTLFNEPKVLQDFEFPDPFQNREHD